MTFDGGLARLVGFEPERIPTLVANLARSHITVACAESLTGGLLCALLTEVPGASAVVRGGLVVYATELKHELAGVDADLLARRGPVDREVAIQLARGARTVCRATVGIGLTGVAGPDPQDGVPVGTWFVALEHGGIHRVATGSPAGRPDDAPSVMPQREQIRNDAVRAAVDLLTTLVVDG